MTLLAIPTAPERIAGTLISATTGDPVPLHAAERDSYASTALSEIFDRAANAALSRFTGGLSPPALMLAFADWSIHLAMAPGKRHQLWEKGFKKWMRFLNHVARCMSSGVACKPCIEPLPQDKRFAGDAWKAFPYTLVWQTFLLQQQWWHNATTGVPGLSTQHEQQVSFTARQILDVFAPSNFVLTNPEVLERTLHEGGMNLVRGFVHFMEDRERATAGRLPVGAEAFIPGRDVAISPGKVVVQNSLMELLQYEPTTATVRREPILIVPAWIMKYYILDLSPNNSLVRYLCGQGFTVFMISWKNPSPEDRELDLDDYRKSGVMTALDAISSIVPGSKIHTAGYCLGGTLLSIASAAMARDSDNRLQSVTLLAAETDFSEAGELALFIDEGQLDFLDDVMWEQGFLDTKQMAGAFQLLRSNDLVWSRVVHDYLLGERKPMSDLLAWNADATRMPYKMHSQYLTDLFLNNKLADGRFHVEKKPVALSDIELPIFAVGTEWDHVAPWRSVFKIHLLMDSSSITFALTSGGHNVGIVSEPGRSDRHYRVMSKERHDRYVDPDTWLSKAQYRDGSWWPEWAEWLNAHSSGQVAPPSMGSEKYPPLGKAPGTYVLQD